MTGTQAVEIRKRVEREAHRRRAALRGVLTQVVAQVLLFVLAFFLLLPLLFMVSTSLKVTGKEFTYPPEFIPRPVVWRNYIEAMTQPGLPFAIFYKNTIYITLLSIAGNLITASMAGFAFGRLRFPLRDKLFILVISTMMLPFAVTMVPTYLLFNAVGWLNTFKPLWIPHWFGGGAFNIFLFRQYFRTIPIELDEAARIDGAGNWHIWLGICLPLSQPVIATVAIFSFISGWTDFMGPLIYLNSMDKRTIALGLYAFVDQYSAGWNYMMAATTLSILPIVLVFVLGQRYFVRGITMTGMAGR